MAYVLEEGIQGYLRALSGHFDKRAHGVPVLRVDDREGGGFWKLTNFRLTLIPGTGSTALSVALDLRAHTLATLATALTNAGYTTSSLDPHLTGVAAAALAEQSGARYDGTAYLSLATNPLWRLFGPVAQLGEEGRDGAAGALAQLDLRLAAGVWLDRLADLYGTRRHDNETDAQLRIRLRFHAIGRHTTKTGLGQLIHDVAGVAVSVDDGPIDFFRCGQHSSRTLTRSQRTPRRLLPGVRPIVTVTLHETLPPDTAPYPVADEFGARFWVRCWAKDATTHGSRLVTARSGEGAMRLPIGAAGRARRFPDPVLATMRPQRAGRALWRLVDTYKAAGVAQVIRLPHVIALTDRTPDELPLQNGAAGQGQNSVPTTGYVRSITLTHLVSSIPPTSRVGQAAATSATVTGPLIVHATAPTSAAVLTRATRRTATSLYLAINRQTAVDLEWPREHTVVRASSSTTTTILQRAHSRED